jgi:hypothetical protein
MKKDAYYFSHDSNARNDVKILKLRRVFGAEGYGIYWMLIETLRDQKGYCMPIDSVGDLEFDYRVSREKILSIINDFDLFTIHNGMVFYSQSLIERMKPLEQKRQRAVDAANKRWLDAAKGDANAYANAYTNADASKVKESKVEKSTLETEKPTDFLKVGQAKEAAHIAIRVTHKHLNEQGYLALVDAFYIYAQGVAKAWQNKRETQAHFVRWACLQKPEVIKQHEPKREFTPMPD